MRHVLRQPLAKRNTLDTNPKTQKCLMSASTFFGVEKCKELSTVNFCRCIWQISRKKDVLRPTTPTSAHYSYQWSQLLHDAGSRPHKRQALYSTGHTHPAMHQLRRFSFLASALPVTHATTNDPRNLSRQHEEPPRTREKGRARLSPVDAPLPRSPPPPSDAGRAPPRRRSRGALLRRGPAPRRLGREDSPRGT